MVQRAELDYLIYNAPLGYADLILNGDPEEYLKNVAGSHGLEVKAKQKQGASCGRTLPKATDDSDMYNREVPSGNFLLFVVCMMGLFRLPRGKLPLAFLAVPAGKDGRVECPCQTFDGFIGIRGSVCGLFLFVQTHAPLIVPPWQSRARKSKFHFLSGARARMLSALLLRLVAR